MRILRIFAVLALLILWGALPALACLLPQRALTPAEMKCCAQMAGNCSGKMQAAHSCCKPVANQGVTALTAANQVHRLPLAHLAAPLPLGLSPLTRDSIRPEWQVHSPPGAPPTLATILRI